jgi:TPR repeat protein
MERRHPLIRSEGSLSAERNFWKATREVIRLNPQEDNVRGEFWRAWERLILRRAEDGEPEAQNYVGRLYANVAPPKFVHADMCFILAAAQGNRDAAKSHSRLARKMTPDQSAEAERLAAERQKAHGQKPNK